MSRKIEKSAEATLNIGDMQFLKVRSSISDDIDATGMSEDDMKQIHTEMWNEVSVDVRRGMWSLITNLGKTTDADKKLFETCLQKVKMSVKGKNQSGE